MAMVTVGLDSFFTQTVGEGAPVLVIPGLALDLSELTALTRALAEKLQVVGIDNLGAGRSSKPDEPYTLSRMAAGPAAVLGTITGPCTVLMAACSTQRHPQERDGARPQPYDQCRSNPDWTAHATNPNSRAEQD